jgi:hypothetical protein
MRFVDQEDDASTAFVLFGRQQVLGLGNQLGLEATRHRAQGTHESDVQAARPDGRVRQVDDVVRRLIQLADGGAQRNGLADADLTGDDAQQRLVDTEADARYRLLVAGAFAQLGGGDGLREPVMMPGSLSE